MQVYISSVIDNDPIIVQFACDIGFGSGRWVGNCPREHRRYSVELEIDQTLRVGTDLRPALRMSPSIESTASGIALTGRVTHVFDNNTASLCVGDAVLLFDYEGEAFFTVDSWIEIIAKSLALFDSNL